MTGMIPDIHPGFTDFGPWTVSLGYPFYIGSTGKLETQKTAEFTPSVTL